MDLYQEIFFRLVRNGMRVHRLLAKPVMRMEALLGGLSLGGLDGEYLQRLTSSAYSDRGDYRLEELFPWEERWFEEDLPKAPAKLLIGGAGTGREARHLGDKGYEYIAFDPAASFARRGKLRSDLRGCLDFLEGSYEDLAQPGDEKAKLFLEAVEENAPYAAVLLGWGSFTHMALPEMRLKLLQRLKSLCPDGPLLLSFWMRSDDSRLDAGRLWKLGFRIGSTLTGGGKTESDMDGDSVSSRAGYGHHFSRDEFEKLCRDSGYEAYRPPPGPHSGTFPHTTLQPT